ncbi:MAG TPA: hypothetical protein VK968_18540 [Roseimicrobium sp.]|nr:hypothetical protein [Roseimicrobium sp.]
MKKSFLSLLTIIIAFAFVLSLSTFAAETKELPKDVKRVPVTFSGGHDTDPRDGGRPVVLIAAALCVPTEVFRDAFSRVHPADTGKGPTGDEARKNKAALMGALGKHGVTNDRLDEVSNHYRYVRSRNELWKHKDAVANALVKDGKVVGYEIVKGGAGYSSSPTVTVPDIKGPAPKVQIAYGKNLETNGSVAAITMP